MADNDISKRYALNIEVNVDSSSLENLRNIQEQIYQDGSERIEQIKDIGEKYAGYTGYADAPQTQTATKSPQAQSQPQQSGNQQDIQKIANEVQEIKIALQKRDSFPHSEHIENATNLANSDITKQIVSVFNNILSSALGTSHMSAGLIPRDSGFAGTTVDSTGVAKKIAATTGKNVHIGEVDMTDAEYGETRHAEQKILINKKRTEPVKKLALNHESTHVVQEAKGYTGNTLLFQANANSGDLNKDSARYVNEYLTNTAAIIKTALTEKLSFRDTSGKINDTALRDVVDAYNDAISKTSGVMIKDIKSFTDIIRKLSKINISPETFLSMLGSDLGMLGTGHSTRLSSAASLAGYHTKSDGTIRDSNGKIVPDSRLIGLLNSDGTRIKSSDVSSHQMAHFISGSSDTLRGVGTVFNGRDAFLMGASNEFSNLRDFGIQFRPEEDLERINNIRMQSGVSYTDMQRRLRQVASYTYRGKPLITRDEVIPSVIEGRKKGGHYGGGSTIQTRLRRAGNVSFVKRTPVEQILFALGDSGEDISGRNDLNNLSEEGIMDVLKDYIFKGTGTNENEFQLSGNMKDSEGNPRTTELVERYGQVMEKIRTRLGIFLESGDAKNGATFIGTNRLNATLGDLVHYIRVARKGVKYRYIPSSFDRIMFEQPIQNVNKDGDQMGDSIENTAQEDIYNSDGAYSPDSQLDERDYEEKRNRTLRLLTETIPEARRQLRLRLQNASSNGSLTGSDLVKRGNDSNYPVLMGKRVYSEKDIDEIERLVREDFSAYQNEMGDTARRDTAINMREVISEVIRVLYPGQDIRNIDMGLLGVQGSGLLRQISSMPSAELERIRKQGYTDMTTGTRMSYNDIMRIRGLLSLARKDSKYGDLIEAAGISGFSPSKMEASPSGPTSGTTDKVNVFDKKYYEIGDSDSEVVREIKNRLIGIRKSLRERRIQIGEERGIELDSLDKKSRNRILSRDTDYVALFNTLKEDVNLLISQLQYEKNSKQEEVNSANAVQDAKDRAEKDINTRTQYNRKGIRGGKKDTVTLGIKADSDESSIMSSIYSMDYGPYNMAVGNLEQLSSITKAPLEILKKIRKNRSYMDFIDEEGHVKDSATLLTASMDDQSISRMRLLEDPLKRVISASGSMSGNAEKRILAIKDILSNYLSEGITGAKHQLGEFDDFVSIISSKFKEFNAKNQSVDAVKARELYDAIKYFNTRTIEANSGHRDIDASPWPRSFINPKDVAKSYPGVQTESFYREKESFEESFRRRLNRMIRSDEGDVRQIYLRDFDISDEGSTALLQKALGKKIKPSSIDNEYERHQYKLISDESKKELDYATGSSVVDKKELGAAATALHKLGRTINPFSIDYKEGLTAAHYDLGDLSKYSRDEIAKMVKAAQNIGFQQTNADLIEVLYKKGKKGRRELTARSNDAILDTKELSIHDAFSGDRSRYFVEHSNALIRGHLGQPSFEQESDVFASLSSNIKKLFNRFANGGASSSEIKKIAEDVAAIRGILSNGDKNDVGANGRGTKANRGTRSSSSGSVGFVSKMEAEDLAKNVVADNGGDVEDSQEKERIRRRLLAEGLVSEEQTDSRRFMTPKIEHAIFETQLADATTKAEKLRIIKERLDKVSSEGLPQNAGEKEREQRELYIEGLRKRYNFTKNDTREAIDDKESYREWLGNLKKRYEDVRTLIKGQANPRDIIGIADSEIYRLSQQDVSGPRENDRRREVAIHIARLLQMRSVAQLRQSRVDDRAVVGGLKESYRISDAAFASGYKSFSNASEKINALLTEISNVEESIASLERLIRESRSNGKEELATSLEKVLTSRRVLRESLSGKYNREVINSKKSLERDSIRGISASQREAREGETINRRMVNKYNQMGTPARSVFERTMAYGAMSAVIYGFVTRYKNAIDIMSKFEKQMLEVTRVMDPMYQAQERLSSSAKRLADEYGVSIVEAAQGMTVFAQQGKNATQIIQLTEASLLAANTTTMNAAQATEALTAALRQFNLSDSDAKKVIDSWLEVESRTAIQAGTMADAIKISGTAARIAGLSFHEFNGILSAVGSATRETGSQLGTAFKFIISKMNTEDVINSLQKLGIATHNQDGSLRDMMLRLSDINSKWKDMTTEERASLAITIAGTRRYNTFMTLMERWPEALDAIAMSEDSHGKAMRMNAMIMDTYEKRVQKAKASIESFYASMSKDTTKGFLGGIQKSIELLAKLGEKSNIVGSLAQIGIIAGGFGMFTRLGGTMGVNAAVEDIGLRDRASKKVEDYFLRERASSFGLNQNSWFSRNFAVGDASGRALYMSRLNSLVPEVQFNQETGRNENFNKLSNDAINRLTIEAFPNLKGKENTEAYAVARDRIRTQFEKQLIQQTEYINSLDASSDKMNGFGRKIKAVTEYLGKHAIALQGFGIALQSLSNAKIFEDKNSVTGKNVAGEALDLAGMAASATSVGLFTSKMLKGVKGGGKIGLALAVMMALGKIIEVGSSWIEKGFGSERVSMQRLQKESDRIKTLNTSVSTYQRLRGRELSGEVLASDEINQKESAAEMIAMSSYGSITNGHRGLGIGINEKEVDRLAGLREEFVSSRNRQDEELSFRAMFSGDGADRIRKNLWLAQDRQEKASEDLRKFDAEHTGNLSERNMRRRADLFSRYTSAQEDVQKYQKELTSAMEPFLLFIEKSGKRLSDRVRRGDATLENVESSQMSKDMYAELLKSYNGDESAARSVIAKRLISSNYQRGQIENSESAISNYQKTGKLHMLRKVGDSGNKSTIILRTYDQYGTGFSDQKFEIEKAGNAGSYIEQISKLTGIAKDALLYTGDLSDALFRYNLKEIEKFSELSRKIGEMIENSFKQQLDRVNSISKISTKYSFVGIDKQYKGFDKRLLDYENASKYYAKSIGKFNEEIVKAIIENAKNQNPSDAISKAAQISSRISGERNLLGTGYAAMNELVVSSQKSSMASQIMDAIISNKTKRGTDTDVDDMGHENLLRINEYLQQAGLGFETVQSLKARLASESSEEKKKFLSERVLAAAEIYAKKDAESAAKALRGFEKALDDAADKLKNVNVAIEALRKRNLAISLSNNGLGGIIQDSDIINSYSNMAGKETPADTIVNSQKEGIRLLKGFRDSLNAGLEKEQNKREDVYRETNGKNDQLSMLRRKMADESVARAARRVDEVDAQLKINEEKISQLERLAGEQKAILSKSYGEFKAFMRNLESQSIKSVDFKDINFGVGAQQFDQIKVIDKQNAELNRKLSEFTSRLELLNGKEKLTDEEKREQTELKIKIGEIEAKIGENGKILESANENLLKIHAEAIKRTRQQQIEHFANVLSKSKDTGKTQRDIFAQDYRNTRDIFNQAVANWGSLSNEQREQLRQIGERMETLRDIGELEGNPTFNKQYLLASAQDRAIVDQIMQRRESGETMKQIFSDAGMKELGRSNPLVSQLMDNLMQKEVNQRLLDTNNNMLAIQEKLLNVVSQIAMQNGDTALGKSSQMAKERFNNRKNLPGYANGTRDFLTFEGGGTYDTPTGGKFEEKGVAVVHGKEKLMVANSTFAASYPRTLKWLSHIITLGNIGALPPDGVRGVPGMPVMSCYTGTRDYSGGLDDSGFIDLMANVLAGKSNGIDVSAASVFRSDNVSFPKEFLSKFAMLKKEILSGVEAELATVLGVKNYYSTNENMSAKGALAFNHNGNIVDSEGKKNAVHEIFHGGDSRRSYNFMDDSRRSSGSQEAISEIARLIYSRDRRETGYTNNRDIDKIVKIVGDSGAYSRKMIRLLESISTSSKDFATIKKYFGDVSSRVGDKKAPSKMEIVKSLTEFAAVEMQRSLMRGNAGAAAKINSSVSRMQESVLGKKLAQETFGGAGAENYRRLLNNSYAESPVYDRFIDNIKTKGLSGRMYRREAARLSSEEYHKKYNDLRASRKANYFKEYGVTIRDGKAYSTSNLMEIIRQSAPADFLRAGGLNYVKSNAVNYAFEHGRNFLRNSGAFLIKDYRRTKQDFRRGASKVWNATGGRLIRGAERLANSIYENNTNSGLQRQIDAAMYGDDFAEATRLNKAKYDLPQNKARRIAESTISALGRGFSGAGKFGRRIGNNVINIASSPIRKIRSNYTNSGLQERIDNALGNEDFAEAIRLNKAKYDLPQNKAKRLLESSGQKLRNSRFGKDVRLRYAIASQMVEDAGSFIKNKYNGSRRFMSSVGSTLANDLRNNIEITKAIGRDVWNGTGGRLISGTKNAARSFYNNYTNAGLQNRIDSAMHNEDFAEAIRLNNVKNNLPQNKARRLINSIGDIKVPFTRSMHLNYASKKSGVPLTADFVNESTASPMTLREMSNMIADNHKENTERRAAQREQRAQEKEQARAQKAAEREQSRAQRKAERDAARYRRARGVAESRFNSARSGRGIRSWLRDNFTEAGLERRQTILKNRVRSSAYRYGEATRKFSGANKAFEAASNQMFENFGDGYLQTGTNPREPSPKEISRLDALGKQVAKQKAAQDTYRARADRDIANAREYLPSINRRLAAVKTVNRAFRFVGDKVFKPVANKVGQFGDVSGSAMKLKMLESAYQGGMETFNNIKEGEYWKASESGLRTIGSLHYAGALEKIPGGGKLSKIAPAAFYASGGLELIRGIKNGDAGTMVSGAGNIANAALFSRPMQSVLGRQVERRFGPGSVAKFGKGMGWGMAADLLGTGIEMLGDHYNKPWLKRTGQVVGGTGEAVSDVALTASTMGLNKVVSGAIDAGRFMFDDKYREDYGNRRAHVGGGFIALEQISKLVPGASGAFRALGFDVNDMLNEMNSHYENINISRDRTEALHRNRSNIMGSLLRNDKLKYGANAKREDKMAATAAVFGALKQASKGTLAKGPDANQAAMEAYFRNEDASQMMARYDVSGKKSASVKAQAEMARLRAELSKLDDEDQSWSSNAFGIDWGGEERQKRRNEISRRMAQLEKAGSFDRKKQVENTRQAAQEHFDNLFGRKANVFGKGGILEGLRKKRRDAEVKREEDALSKNQDALAEARNAVFNDDKLTYSYASLADMEHAAKMGDKKAQAELAKFNERASKDKRVTDASGRIAANKKRIADLKGKKIDGGGEITAQDFDDLRQFESSNIEIQTNNKKKEIDKLKSQEKKLKEDIALMEKEGSSADAIKKKQAELQSVQAQIGKATGEVDQLSIGKRVSDRLASGKLADPRKLAAEAAEMEEKRKAARAIYDDPNKIRELNAGKTVTVKIGGKEVTLNKEQVQAWRGISDEAIADKRKEQQAAQEALSAAVSEETVRQDLIKKNGGDASKVTDEDVKKEVERRKAEADKKKKEAEAKEAERRRLASPRGAFDAAKKAFEDAQAAKSKNDKELAGFRSRKKELEGKEKLSDEEKAELADLNKKIESGERRGSVLSGTIASSRAKLDRSTMTLMANVRARKNYTSNDEDVANYRKLRDKNSRREALERKRLGDGTKDLKDDERGALSEEEWKELQEARKTREADEKAAADAKAAVDARTKQDEATGSKLIKQRESELIDGPAGKKLERDRRSLALGRLGLVRVKRNEKGDLEAYREQRKDETAPTASQRAEAIESEHAKADASSVQTPAAQNVAQGTTAKPEAQASKEVTDMSRDTALLAQYMEKLLPIVNNILTVISQNKGGSQQVAQSSTPAAGTKIPSSGA